MTAERELIICCPWNKDGVNPRTGLLWKDGDEFLSEARNYRSFHGISDPVRKVDNRLPGPARFAALICMLEEMNSEIQPRVSSLAFFGHGYKTGLQAGCTLRNAPELAWALSHICTKNITITLYACSAGAGADRDTAGERVPGPGGDGGYADVLRDALGAHGVGATVFAHSTSGHCTRNPYVRVFRPGAHGGEWVVEPTSPEWPAWRRYLADGHGRFSFPRQTKEQIAAVVATTNKETHK